VFYAIHGKNLSAALVTEDGVVLHATGNFEWARGMRIGAVLGYLKRHNLRWHVSDAPPPGLVVRGGAAEWAH
jgi:hypothetical protein